MDLILRASAAGSVARSPLCLGYVCDSSEDKRRACLLKISTVHKADSSVKATRASGDIHKRHTQH